MFFWPVIEADGFYVAGEPGGGGDATGAGASSDAFASHSGQRPWPRRPERRKERVRRRSTATFVSHPLCLGDAPTTSMTRLHASLLRMHVDWPLCHGSASP